MVNCWVIWKQKQIKKQIVLCKQWNHLLILAHTKPPSHFTSFSGLKSPFCLIANLSENLKVMNINNPGPWLQVLSLQTTWFFKVSGYVCLQKILSCLWFLMKKNRRFLLIQTWQKITHFCQVKILWSSHLNWNSRN